MREDPKETREIEREKKNEGSADEAHEIKCRGCGSRLALVCTSGTHSVIPWHTELRLEKMRPNEIVDELKKDPRETEQIEQEETEGLGVGMEGNRQATSPLPLERESGQDLLGKIEKLVGELERSLIVHLERWYRKRRGAGHTTAAIQGANMTKGTVVTRYQATAELFQKARGTKAVCLLTGQRFGNPTAPPDGPFLPDNELLLGAGEEIREVAKKIRALLPQPQVRTFEEVELLNVSIVDDPTDPLCRFQDGKGLAVEFTVIKASLGPIEKLNGMEVVSVGHGDYMTKKALLEAFSRYGRKENCDAEPEDQKDDRERVPSTGLPPGAEPAIPTPAGSGPGSDHR